MKHHLVAGSLLIIANRFYFIASWFLWWTLETVKNRLNNEVLEYKKTSELLKVLLCRKKIPLEVCFHNVQLLSLQKFNSLGTLLWLSDFIRKCDEFEHRFWTEGVSCRDFIEWIICWVLTWNEILTEYSKYMTRFKIIKWNMSSFLNT